MAERSIQSAASDHQETLPFEASPIAKSLTKEAIVEVDSQSPAQPDLARSLSCDFKKATDSTSPGNPLKACYYIVYHVFSEKANWIKGPFHQWLLCPGRFPCQVALAQYQTLPRRNPPPCMT